jgi:anthranilate synthase component 1
VPGASPAQLYRALARANPAPFGGIANFGDCAIVSSSPERLVRVVQRAIDTRPIAGTRPRAADATEDGRLRDELLATAKERAEHIMLVDLERNDLGRVCEPGSVEVPALLELTSYAHVHHLESTVRGRLRVEASPVDVIRALFPGGTITGCPKVRCMQIIRELEAAPRLAYTGSMGYLNRGGDLDLNILIRSFMLRGEALTFWAGAGIVADSVAEHELQETRAKAKGLLRALGMA